MKCKKCNERKATIELIYDWDKLIEKEFPKVEPKPKLAEHRIFVCQECKDEMFKAGMDIVIKTSP